MIAARRARDPILGRALFAEPAWDMMLALYGALLAQHRLPTLDLAETAAVPSTTALRWIDKLESSHVARRVADPLDRRRNWIEMTTEGADRMAAYFRSIRAERLCC